MQAVLDEMIGQAMRHVGRSTDVLPQVRIRVRPHTTQFKATVHTPSLCIVLQGAKQLMIGDRLLRYDPGACFMSSLHVPASGRIVEASPERPFVTANIAIDPEGLNSLSSDLSYVHDAASRGLAIAPATPSLLDPWRRLLSLLDEPDDAPVLAPLIEREILYRLGRERRLPAPRQAAHSDDRSTRIGHVVRWIREHYDQPLRISQLAELAGMSVASLHRHFKAETGTSPLSFQKSQRLQRARLRLMGNENATCVAYAVGYESASQFSREYSRMFGRPPARDVRQVLRLQDRAAHAADDDPDVAVPGRRR